MSHQSVRPGHEVFLKGDVAVNMLFAVSGTLAYASDSYSCMSARRSVTDINNGVMGLDSSAVRGTSTVSKGDWVCEAALWLKWVHMGWLIAIDHAELHDLKTDKFHDIVRKGGVDMHCINRYKRFFTEFVEESQWDDRLKVTDIFSEMHTLNGLVDKACQEQTIMIDIGCSTIGHINSDSGRLS